MIEMTNEEYHAHHAISSSDVKMVHGKSLAHWQGAGRKEKAAWDLGTAVHAMLLEPEKNLVRCGPETRRGNEWKVMQELAEADGAAVMAPATTLQDLGEACRLAQLFISSDTGPLHLAAAVGTPCVGLFGPVPADRNGPYGPLHANVEPPAHLRPAWTDRKTDTQSMLGIEVAAVVAAAERQLSRAAAA